LTQIMAFRRIPAHCFAGMLSRVAGMLSRVCAAPRMVERSMTKMHVMAAGALIAAALLAVSVPAALGHGNQENWGANFGRGYGMVQPGHMPHGPGGYPGHGGYGHMGHHMGCPMRPGMMHQGHMGYGGHHHGMREPGPMGHGPMGHGPMAPDQMGPGQMGPGMMGRGMMDPGHMAPGMMDRGPLGLGPGWIYGRAPLPEPDVDSVRETLEEDLAWVREQDDDTIVAEIVTQDGSLVQRFEIDRRTGRWRQAE
jgi:hypothetical protein